MVKQENVADGATASLADNQTQDLVRAGEAEKLSTSTLRPSLHLLSLDFTAHEAP